MRGPIKEIAARWRAGGHVHNVREARRDVDALLDEVARLEDVCARLQRDRNDIAADLRFVRDDYTDTANMTEEAIAMRGRLALVDGLRALLAEANAEITTLRAMSLTR